MVRPGVVRVTLVCVPLYVHALPPVGVDASVFATPTHTAAAAYVIAGMFDRDHEPSKGFGNTGGPSRRGSEAGRASAGAGAGEGAGAGAGAGAGVAGGRSVSQGGPQPQDGVISRDILVGEVVPVVRLSHLRLLPRAAAVVVLVDVRDCSRGEHAEFVAEVHRTFPECLVLHCPGALLRPVQLTDGHVEPVPWDADELDRSSPTMGHKSSASKGRGVGASGRGPATPNGAGGASPAPVSIALSVLNYDATGGLDVDKLNAAVGSAAGSTSICKRTIESSLRMRAYKRFASLQSPARHMAWLRRAAPELAACRGRCVALYGGTSASNLAQFRDMLVRCGFPSVCGLSLSFLVASQSAQLPLQPGPSQRQPKHQAQQSGASYPAKPRQ